MPGVELVEAGLGAIDEFVDDRAGTVDGNLPDEVRDGEGQARTDSAALRAQGHEVGRLLGLGPLVARQADDPVAPVTPGEQCGFEVVLSAGRETRRRGEVEAVDG